MRPAWTQALQYFGHVVLALALAITGFGSVLFRDQLLPVPRQMVALMAAAVAAVLTLPISARPVWKTSPRRFWLTHLIPFLAVCLALSAIEAWARSQLPPWPARMLHGTSPDAGPDAWGRVQTLFPAAMTNNSWGERDAEHSLAPDQRVRIAFIGDSFLEESSITPVPTLAQNMMGDHVELLNLGVSTTGTDSYYWRMKSVALPLGAQHIVCFLYVGNDIIETREWAMRDGLIDVPPADSLMGRLFPGTTAWLERNAHSAVAGWLLPRPLHAREQQALEQLRAAAPDQFAEALATLYTGAKKEELQRALAARDLTDFRTSLLQPDMGLFRTYVLTYGLSTLVGERMRDDRATAERDIPYTMRWVRKMKELADARSIPLTVVLVPVAYDVDDRFIETWAPIVDFTTERTFNTWRASQLQTEIQASSIDLVNLYDVLANQRGSYLNVDGHWSALGNHLVARAVSDHLKTRYPR